jgi:hypothetical protein
LRPLYTALTISLMVIQIVAVLGALARPAYGYTDPGSGLLALQIVSTSFAGVIFLIRRRLRSFFGSMRSKPKNECNEQE